MLYSEHCKLPALVLQVASKFPLMLFMLSDVPAPTFSPCEPS